MNPRHRVFFLIAFAVPEIGLIVLNSIYHIPYAFPVAGLLALFLGLVYIRLLKARRTAVAPRRRNVYVAVKLYLGFALVAGVNIIADGWHWYDVLYSVFPTVFSAIMFSSNREKLKKESAQSNS
jgi:hypothetical protein